MEKNKPKPITRAEVDRRISNLQYSFYKLARAFLKMNEVSELSVRQVIEFAQELREINK